MAADQQFCLRWNNHQSTLISVFDSLLTSGQLVDCTLAAEGQFLKAHKVVLSACSPYLEVLLSQHYEKHPIVILKDVKFQELKSMMDYMYRGEVNISQDQLGTFLKAAESLQIKGLSDSGGENDSRDVGSTNKRQDVPAPATRKSSVPTSQPRSPAVIPQSSNSGLTIEPRRSHVDVPPSSPLRSREGSVSPTPRKRRRQRRPSQGDENQLSSDSHLDTSNSCDLPSQAQSNPVPTIPLTMTPVVPSSAPSTVSKPNESDAPLETEQLNRLGSNINSNVSMDTGLIKEKLEPTSEILLEPKTEYLDEVNNEDSVEDLTLDDDDDMDSSNMDMSRPGPSHVDSNQSFTPWQHMQSGDRSGTDEVFMAAQEAVGAHRDSQATTDSEEEFLDDIDDEEELGDCVPSGQCRMRSSNSGAGLKRVKRITKSLKDNRLSNITDVAENIPAGGSVQVWVSNKPRSSQSHQQKQTWLINYESSDNHLDNFYLNNVNIPIELSIKTETVCNNEKMELNKSRNTDHTYVMKDSNNIHNNHSSSGGSSSAYYETSGSFICVDCGRAYKLRTSFLKHRNFECNKEPRFKCSYCPMRCHQKHSLKRHIINIHNKPH